MTRPDLDKLLGGYAAGTLTPEERRALFEAALADQTLFDALADEEALREVLADPACRERVRSALVEPPRTVWLRRPTVWAFAAAVAAALVLTVAVTRTKPPAPQQLAIANKPALPDFVASAPEQQAARATKPQALTEVRPALNVPAPAVTVTGVRPAAPASPAVVVANAPALAAPRKEHAAAPPARTATLAAGLRPSEPGPSGNFTPPPALAGSRPAASPAQPNTLAARLGPSGQGAAGGIAAAPPLAASPVVPPPPPRAVPPPPSPAAYKQDAGARLQSEAVETAEAARALVGRDASQLKKLEWAPANSAFEAKGKAEPAFGLRYTLLRRGAQNKDTEVPPDTPFSPGESARLRIEADRSGYLYVLAGNRALFAGSVPANQPVLIDTKERVLHLMLLPEPDSGPLSTLVSRTQRQFSGLNQRVDVLADQRRGEQSVSVQNSSPPPQAGVLTDVSINSR